MWYFVIKIEETQDKWRFQLPSKDWVAFEKKNVKPSLENGNIVYHITCHA